MFQVTLAGRQTPVLQTAGALYVKDIAANGMVALTRGDYRTEVYASSPSGRDQDLSWLDATSLVDMTPDGRRVLLLEQGEGEAAYACYLRDLGKDAPVRLFSGIGTTISPDGRWVLGFPQDRRPPLSLQPIGPGRPRALPQGAIEQYDWAHWFPDGQRIVFSGFEHDSPGRCYVQDIAGGPAHAITAAGTNLFNPGAGVSPDGSRLVYRGADGHAMLLTFSSGQARPVPNVNPDEYAIRWTADGQGLFVAKSPTGEISRIDLRDGSRAHWLDPKPDDPAGVRSVSMIQITPDGRTCFYSLIRDLGDLYVAREVH